MVFFWGGGGWLNFDTFLYPDRWERAQGKFCRTSTHDSVSPEAVRDNWEAITDFTDADHPSSNREGMAILVGVRELCS